MCASRFTRRLVHAETVYGLGANALSEEAVLGIFKVRSAEKNDWRASRFCCRVGIFREISVHSVGLRLVFPVESRIDFFPNFRVVPSGLWVALYSRSRVIEC